MLDLKQTAQNLVDLKIENGKLRAMLERLEWCNSDPTAFAIRFDGQFTAHRCPICNHSKELESFHSPSCELAALLRNKNEN